MFKTSSFPKAKFFLPKLHTWHSSTWIWNLGLPLTSYVALRKSLYFLISKREIMITVISGCSIIKWVNICKNLEQWQAHRKTLYKYYYLNEETHIHFLSFLPYFFITSLYNYKSDEMMFSGCVLFLYSSKNFLMENVFLSWAMEWSLCLLVHHLLSAIEHIRLLPARVFAHTIAAAPPISTTPVYYDT